MVHELLIRVMGDVSVPDGQDYVDLGLNFREIVETIHRQHIGPHMGEIVAAHRELRRRAAEIIEQELASGLFARPASSAPEPVAERLLGHARASAAGRRSCSRKASRTASAASSPHGSGAPPRATIRCRPARFACSPRSAARSPSGMAASAAIVR